MMWYLHCSYCKEKIFKTEIDPKPKYGDALIAQHWKYMGGGQVEVGDRFFCSYCECDFQPMVEGVSCDPLE